MLKHDCVASAVSVPLRYLMSDRIILLSPGPAGKMLCKICPISFSGPGFGLPAFPSQTPSEFSQVILPPENVARPCSHWSEAICGSTSRLIFPPIGIPPQSRSFGKSFFVHVGQPACPCNLLVQILSEPAVDSSIPCVFICFLCGPSDPCQIILVCLAPWARKASQHIALHCSQMPFLRHCQSPRLAAP